MNLTLTIPTQDFALVKQVFEMAAEDAPIAVEGAREAVKLATTGGEAVTLTFATVADRGAFLACLVVGEDDEAVTDEFWERVIVPLIRDKPVRTV